MRFLERVITGRGPGASGDPVRDPLRTRRWTLGVQRPVTGRTADTRRIATTLRVGG